MKGQREQNGLPILLALDTTTSSLTVAVVNGKGVIGEKNMHSERNHSIRLVPAIRDLVKECGLEFGELAGIAVGKGPGSYTGVRIGVTVAKTMAWSLNLPLIAVSSLEAMAFGAYQEAKGEEERSCWIVPLMDARRGQVYTGLYAGEGEKWECLEADGIRSLARWREELADRWAQLGPARRPEMVLFAGDGAFLQEHLDGTGGTFPCGVRLKPWRIRAADLGRLALAKYERRETEPVHSFVPNYTQLAEAEVKWLAGEFGRERS